jgi:excisionase family DNA binding protein
VEEAVAFTGLKRTFLYKLMLDGKLPYTTVGRRRLLFRSGLRELLRRGAVVG